MIILKNVIFLDQNKSSNQNKILLRFKCCAIMKIISVNFNIKEDIENDY